MKTLSVWSPRPDASDVVALSNSVFLYGLPIIKIIPIELSQIDRERVQQAQALLFVSQSSVKMLMQQMSAQEVGEKLVIAIGQKTAETLSRYDMSPNFVSKPPFNSEQLLSDDEFAHLAYEDIALVCGVGGRRLLEETLRSRHKNVTRINCYRRDKVHYCKQYMVEFITKNRVCAVIVSSCEIADAVLACLDSAALKRYFDWPVFVLSQRVGDYTRSLGFTEVIVAPHASQQSLNQSILTWWGNR